ncbi:hypothetical protein DXG03_005926 [Asterophora parasitica]|uniref:Uncharacterized protein n=1 Tax=Asterophora parasitica TaxID=117018 RepID=A0A9P7G932_9AGAR|nr:hypothetical protein DXG03_005926 [Asterophora parasitica]
MSLRGATPTQTLSARQAASSPLLVFNAPDQPTSCLDTLFTWNYAGPDAPLSLTVTNVGVSQASTTSNSPRTFTNPFTNPATRQAGHQVSLLIADLLDPSSGSYNWTKVTVLPGFYVLVGAIQSAGYSTITAPFFVQPGNDVSCLGTQPSPSPSSTFSSSSSSVSSSSSNFPPTVTPIGGSGEETRINKGAIAGGVVAGVLVLLGALAIYIIFICLPRRRARSRHARSPSKSGALAHSHVGGDGHDGGGAGRWGGLSSVDSHMVMNETPYTKTLKKSKKPYTSTAAKRHHSTTSSASVGPFAGGVGASQDNIQLYSNGNGTRSRSGSVAQNYNSSVYLASPSEEKLGMTLLSSPGRASSPPANNPNPNPAHAYSASSHAEAPQRRTSLTQGRPRRSVDSTASQLQSPFATPPASSPLSPVSPTAAMVGLARAPSAGSGSTAHPPSSSSHHTQPQAQTQAQRKTPRKPVPVYSSSSPPTSPVSPPAPPLSPAPPTQALPPTFDPHPMVHTSSQGHYATRAERESLKSLSPAQSGGKRKSRSKSKGPGRDKVKDKGGGNSANASRESLASNFYLNEYGNGSGSGREVAHKSSFGPGGVEGRPLHYLIPDMPAQQ